MPLFCLLMKKKAPRRWLFNSYRKEQLAVKKLSEDILSGVEPGSPVILVWGNGGFPTSTHGHASAPNKKLQYALSKFMPVIVSSEHNSSKISSCCHSVMNDCRKQRQKRRTTVYTCCECNTMLSRDFTSSCVISDIFRWQQERQTSELPPFAKSEVVRSKREVVRSNKHKSNSRNTC